MKFCRVWGDPHIRPFDHPPPVGWGAHFQDEDFAFKHLNLTGDNYKNGDYWLVNSDTVKIQGRFWADMSFSSLRMFAVSGSMLDGGKLVVEPARLWQHVGNIILNGQTLEITADGQEKQHGDGLLSIKAQSFGYSGQTFVSIKFTKDSKLELNLLRDNNFIDLDIGLAKREGKVSGLCGNMEGKDGKDGNKDGWQDDVQNMVDGASKVQDQDLLFPYAAFDVIGCGSASNVDDGFVMRNDGVDAQTRAAGTETLVTLCARTCKGKGASFVLAHADRKTCNQDNDDSECRKCFCAKSATGLLEKGRPQRGPPPGVPPPGSTPAMLKPGEGNCSAIKCFEGNMSTGSSCVYSFKMSAKKPQDCEKGKMQEGLTMCRKCNLTSLALESCVFDSCFADAPMVNGDCVFTPWSRKMEKLINPSAE